MKIHIVSKLVEDADGPVSANTVSAHIDPDRAEDARNTIDQDPAAGYGVIETVELDLSGHGSLLQALRDQVIRQQARLARGRGRS